MSNVFSQKTGFDISCILSPNETIFMKYQNLFSGSIKKNISKCRLLKFLPSIVSADEDPCGTARMSRLI